ncbi:hypothetical protein N0V93_006959 [Gnomoniopsis smithogilvyi]|uniref:Carboxymuconolactone decarboxylase-like domain-containing protein n=1 Tax=Gnomoniopsis smithogilvyi TaxID=1191159 RepID=A0A9W8YSW6_9PEZI|nr:hypothetical protein N0V93_006959 [Gnomoniopsis smithogilvyi]
MAAPSDRLITAELLDTLRSQPHLPVDIWYLVIATTLCVLNRPEEIQPVYNHVVGPGHGLPGLQNGVGLSDQEQLRIVRRLREALLKTSAIGGIPKTINALQELKKAVPVHLADEPCSVSPSNRRRDIFETPTSQVLDRGQAFFNNCYGKVAERVMTSLDHSGTEDLGLAVRLTYGYVLSTTAILSEAETSFVMIAGLIPQDVNAQLKGHLKGALNGGASVEQVRAVRQLAINVCEAAGMRVLPHGHALWGWRTQVQDL